MSKSLDHKSKKGTREFSFKFSDIDPNLEND
jgi:hypothetical protein